MSREDARSTEEDAVATENAVAAVAKILKYAGGKVDINQVWRLWTSLLLM